MERFVPLSVSPVLLAYRTEEHGPILGTREPYEAIVPAADRDLRRYRLGLPDRRVRPRARRASLLAIVVNGSRLGGLEFAWLHTIAAL